MNENIPLPALRRDLRFTPHVHMAQVWYAVEDPQSGRFWKLGRDEYLAAIEMDGNRSAAEVAYRIEENGVASNLTATAVMALSQWLAGVGLLQLPNRTVSNAAKFGTAQIVWDPLNARFPLLKGRWVERIAHALQPLISPIAVIGVCVLAVLALVVLILNWEVYWTRSEKLFVAEGRLWWLAAWLLLKTIHECGHAVTAVKAGCQIRSAGISFIFFAPVPFIDVSDLWSIPNRWQRILVSSGGILFEMTVAVICVFIAVLASHDSLAYFACAVATTGTITTLIFNANPFVRFDGYFILADLVHRPNLWMDGQSAARNLARRLFIPFAKRSERYPALMIAYGLACWFSRVVTMIGFAMWAVLVWQELGMLLVAWAGYAWFVAPWWKSNAAARTRSGQPWITYLWQSRAWASPMALMVVAIVSCIVPSPIQPLVPGMVDFEHPSIVRSQSEGFLVEVHAQEFREVRTGELLAVFRNDQLKYQVEAKRIEVAETRESISVYLAKGEISNAQAEKAKLAALEDQLNQLEQNIADLEVRATADGVVVHSDLAKQIGRFFRPGEPLLVIADPGRLEVKLMAGQAEQELLSRAVGRPLQLIGLNSQRYTGMVSEVDVRGSDKLDEPTLSANYGGPITVKVNHTGDTGKGMVLPAPRFEVTVRVPDAVGRFVPGQLAWACLPSSSKTVAGMFHKWLLQKWESVKLQNPAEG